MPNFHRGTRCKVPICVVKAICSLHAESTAAQSDSALKLCTIDLTRSGEQRAVVGWWKERGMETQRKGRAGQGREVKGREVKEREGKGRKETQIW